KTGVILYSKALALTEASSGVTVNVVSPGVIENSISSPLQELPMGRVGRLDEIVGAVRYFISPAADYVTGTTLGVAGGWNVRRGGAAANQPPSRPVRRGARADACGKARPAARAGRRSRPGIPRVLRHPATVDHERHADQRHLRFRAGASRTPQRLGAGRQSGHRVRRPGQDVPQRALRGVQSPT